MEFLHYPLGHRCQGEIVEIVLEGNAANIRLMDAPNFNRYRTSDDFRYRGGLAVGSPVRLQIPHAGEWHVVVDMDGCDGTVRTSARVL